MAIQLITSKKNTLYMRSETIKVPSGVTYYEGEKSRKIARSGKRFHTIRGWQCWGYFGEASNNEINKVLKIIPTEYMIAVKQNDGKVLLYMSIEGAKVLSKEIPGKLSFKKYEIVEILTLAHLPITDINISHATNIFHKYIGENPARDILYNKGDNVILETAHIERSLDYMANHWKGTVYNTQEALKKNLQ